MKKRYSEEHRGLGPGGETPALGRDPAPILAFGRISRIAALLLNPYLLWVSFATVLNYSTWRLNA